MTNTQNIQLKQTIALAITGASGIPYARRLLAMLIQTGQTVWLTYSKAGQTVAVHEENWILPTSPKEATERLSEEFQAKPQQLHVFAKEDWFAPMASGTNPPDSMVICPASMGCVGAIAHGLADNLIERSADVCLKEKRRLVIVPRETPFSTIHLQNMLILAQAGAVILPPIAGFYHQPKSIEDMVDFVVARILDHLGIAHNIIPKWGD